MNTNKRPEKPTKTYDSKMKKFLSEYLYPFLWAAAVALFLTKCVFFNARVPTESMVPTIQAGDRFLGSRTAYLFDKPKQGDMVVFRSYELNSELYDSILVKRVIATEGDRVYILDGRVFVNDIPLEEPYLNNNIMNDMSTIYVPEGCCFVMGDNRGSSYDARYWLNPFVRYDDIYAKVIWVIHL